MSTAPGHFVDDAPFDANAERPMSASERRLANASQWQIMRWKLQKHKLAMVSGLFLLILYASIPFTEVIAPYGVTTRDADHIYAPPQQIHLFHEGRFIGPFVYGYDKTVDLERFLRIYTPNPDKVQPLRFFCRGDPYRFWGLWRADVHMVCPADGGTLFLLGTDRLGRDVFSRLVYGVRISLTIGLAGILVSLVLGVVIGGLAGYYGGRADWAVQRVTETLRSLPELPLWMALAAALPVTASPLAVFFGITLILGLLDWPDLARAVRSKFMALREEDFVMAARLMGASDRRIIFRHMLPNFASHLIASATLSIPTMILGETALSFLGLGLRAPMVSWGVMLNDAQNLAAIEFYPWLLAPVAPVVLTVLAFNFLGDGLRDAADPYK